MQEQKPAYAAEILADTEFRTDLLFFIRLAATYCKTIFWQAFLPSAKARRQTLLAVFHEYAPKKTIKQIHNIDVLNGNFIFAARKLADAPAPQLGGQTKPQIELAINQIFSNGLRARHGLPWCFDDYIAVLENLREWRNYLEHYADKQQAQKPLPDGWPQLLHNLGLLLLQEFHGELRNSIERIGTKAAWEARSDAAAILSAAKKQRNEAIAEMFHRWRCREAIYAQQPKNKNGQPRNKIQKSRELNYGEWRRYYEGLCYNNSEHLRQNSFRLAYDFIGKSNFRAICARLGAPLQEKRIPFPDKKQRARIEQGKKWEEGLKIQTAPEAHFSFFHEIKPFYVITVRLQKVLHFYLENFAEAWDKAEITERNKRWLIGKIKDETLREARNKIAHNGLVWRVKSAAGIIPLTDIFTGIFAILNLRNPLVFAYPRKGGSRQITPKIFYDKIIALLAAEDCPIGFQPGEDGKAPAYTKLKTPEERQAWEVKAQSRIFERHMLRKCLSEWRRDLDSAYAAYKKAEADSPAEK